MRGGSGLGGPWPVIPSRLDGSGDQQGPGDGHIQSRAALTEGDTAPSNGTLGVLGRGNPACKRTPLIFSPAWPVLKTAYSWEAVGRKLVVHLSAARISSGSLSFLVLSFSAAATTMKNKHIKNTTLLPT